MLTESLVEAFRSRLEQLGLDLADLRIGGTPNRPLVQVRIDWPPPPPPAQEPPRRVTVADCTRASRALEAWLDAGGAQGGLLGPRYVLEVSSPGLERPLRWHRHWRRFVGHDVRVKLAGLGRVRARIVDVPSDDRVVLEPEGRPATEYRLADLKDARLASDVAEDR